MKIIFAVTIAFGIAFSIFFIFLKINFVDRVEVSIEKEIKFYSQDVPLDEKKIFILGSSHIMAVNTTYVEQYLSNENMEYTVYNLAKGGDVPKDRIPTLEYLISTKPDIVVYGIADRDFRGLVPIQQESANTPESPLPNLQNAFDEIFWNILPLKQTELDFLSNPKLTTLVVGFNLIQSILDNDDREKPKRKNITPFSNMPFFKIGETETLIRTDKEIENIFSNIYEFRELPPSYKNPQVISFKQIINDLQNNNIKIIIFVTPHHEIYQKSVPYKVTQSFNNIIDELEKENKIEIFSLYDKYNNLPVWNNPSHIAVNEDAILFSEDLAKLIVQEIKK